MVLDTLPPRERDIFERRIGYGGRKPETLQEIGDSYGITIERTRQLEAKAIRLLKHPSRSNKLRIYNEP